MGIEYAVNGDARIAYETFGTAGEPLLLVLGLDYQMVWWPDAFCERLVEAGYHVARYDNRDTGLSTHYPEPADGSPWRALLGGTRPLYTMTDMIGDGLAVMDALGWADAHVLGGTSAIAQGMALLHPGRVRGLTLSSGRTGHLPRRCARLRAGGAHAMERFGHAYAGRVVAVDAAVGGDGAGQ